MAKISVIIPIYNVENYLEKCLQSVINQTFKDIEILCIDDCGNDNSVNIAEKYARKDNRIKIIHHKNNKGLGGARNTGMKEANGEFIFFIDSDDWIRENGLELMYNKAIQENANIVLTGEDLYIDETKSYAAGWRNFYNMNFVNEITENIFHNTFTPAWARLYRKNFLEKYNLQFVEKTFYEDNSWGCFIALLAQNIAFVENIYFYRRREGAITNKIDKKAFDWVEDYKFYKNFIIENNIKTGKEYLAESWYLLNFRSYFRGMTKENKRIFYKKITEIIDSMNIDYKTIYNLSFLSKKDKKRLCVFYGYLLSKNFDNKVILYKTNNFMPKIHIGRIR